MISLDYRSYMGSSARIWSLRWLFLYLCSYNLDGSITAAPSRESRSRWRLNFGKTHRVSQSLFSLCICDLLVLLELVFRSLIGDCNLDWKDKFKRSSWELYRQNPCIPDASGIDTGHVRYFPPMLNLFNLCSNLFVVGFKFLDILYTPCLPYWITREGLFLWFGVSKYLKTPTLIISAFWSVEFLEMPIHPL
jgi:hypothetical protein